MSISITVSGYSSGTYAPERARVPLTVRAEGTDRAKAAKEVAAVHTQLSAELQALEDQGAISEWSSESVSTYSYRPFDRDGKPQKPMQVATVSVSAEFSDFEELSPAVDRWLRDARITIGRIDWSLTDEHRTQRLDEIRRESVAVAVAKAQSYADALGAGTVQPTEIADDGMLAGQPTSGPAGGLVPGATPRAFAAAAAPAESVELRPQDITIGVSVEARFTAELR